MPLKTRINGNLRQVFAASGTKNRVDDLLDPDLLTRMTESHSAGNADKTAIITQPLFLNRWIAKWASAE
jgi:hypothetical protein